MPPALDFENREKEEQIWEILNHEPKPIKAKYFAEHLGTTERMVRIHIRNLISRGFSIASMMEPPYGYFVPRTASEAERYSRQLKSRIRSIAERLADFDKITAHKVQRALEF